MILQRWVLDFLFHCDRISEMNSLADESHYLIFNTERGYKVDYTFLRSFLRKYTKSRMVKMELNTIYWHSEKNYFEIYLGDNEDTCMVIIYNPKNMDIMAVDLR
jgi:hypothetical protein